MRVLIDTNILISAVLFPLGKARSALIAVAEGDDDALVCDYSILEVNAVFARKLPDMAGLLPQFMAYLGKGVTMVSTPATRPPPARPSSAIRRTSRS